MKKPKIKPACHRLPGGVLCKSEMKRLVGRKILFCISERNGFCFVMDDGSGIAFGIGGVEYGWKGPRGVLMTGGLYEKSSITLACHDANLWDTEHWIEEGLEFLVWRQTVDVKGLSALEVEKKFKDWKNSTKSL